MKFSPLLIAPFVTLLGCMAEPNPSFPITFPEGQAKLKEMRADRKPLARPVVVVDGYLDPGAGSLIVASNIRRVSANPDQVIRVNLVTCLNFDACRTQIIDAVEAAFPWSDPNETREVDVVAISMGGLAARYAAVPARREPATQPIAASTGPATVPSTIASTAPATAPTTAPAPAVPWPTGKRLKIARLFTLSTPHQGAILADFPSHYLIPVQRDMRRGSAFLSVLNGPEQKPDYPIIPYIRLTDDTVGVAYSAPPGQTPIWVQPRPMESTHVGVVWDARITADICRRLRGEAPLVTEPLAAVPK